MAATWARVTTPRGVAAAMPAAAHHAGTSTAMVPSVPGSRGPGRLLRVQATISPRQVFAPMWALASRMAGLNDRRAAGSGRGPTPRTAARSGCALQHTLPRRTRPQPPRQCCAAGGDAAPPAAAGIGSKLRSTCTHADLPTRWQAGRWRQLPAPPSARLSTFTKPSCRLRPRLPSPPRPRRSQTPCGTPPLRRRGGRVRPSR